jgi:subtilisin-like proprotein convertase family protein
MPKHASSAATKTRPLSRYRPLVETLEDRTIPGSMLLGPSGMISPFAMMPDGIRPAAEAAAQSRVKEALRTETASSYVSRQRYLTAVQQFLAGAQNSQTPGGTARQTPSSSSSLFGSLPTDTNGNPSAAALKQITAFIANRSSSSLFANAFQTFVSQAGTGQVTGNVPGQSTASKEWTTWLSAVNPELFARAQGVSSMGGPGSGGGGGGSTGGTLDKYGTVGTPQWLVTLKPGVNSGLLAPVVGAVNKRAAYTANTFVWQFPTTMPRDQVVARLNSLSQVVSFQQVVIHNTQGAFDPNDPLYPAQWHLNDTDQGLVGVTGIDANVRKAWDTVRGRGVEIGIVDEGVDHTHRDLFAHYDFVNDFDFVDGDNDAMPTDDGEAHGTAVAGVAAAIGNNFLGVSGVAPEARMAGLRILGGGGASDLAIADALTHAGNIIDVYNNSWGLSVGYVFGFPENAQLLAAIQQGARFGRGGLGSVYVFAAGNSGGVPHNWDANFMVPNNSPYVMTVGAIDNFGHKSEYSQAGANVFVSAPSNGGSLGIVTTDRPGDSGYGPGDYTFDFGGTSSATPVVSGVVALMLEANPNLGYRDVQEIIARTARKVDPTDSQWKTNGAGLHVNPKYGFGIVDATAAVNMARTWTNLSPMQSFDFYTSVNQNIPDFDPKGVTSTINVPQNFTVERVIVTVDATYPARGDLQLTLQSPSGTKSILQPEFVDNDPQTAIHTLPFQTWTYTSAQELGEKGQGDWKLNIADLVPGYVGTFNNWQVSFFGHASTGGGGGGGGGGGVGDVSNDAKYEPNDTSDRASGLGFISSDLTIANLGIVAKATQDRDWFRFTPTVAGQTSVSITMQPGAGDLDLRVYRRLFDGTFVQVGSSLTRQAGGTETVSFNALKNQTYYISVYGFQGAKGAYDLNINVNDGA